MVDVPKVPGSGGPADSQAGGKASRPDADKFRDLMKVGDTDADQRKKKKQQQEALEETKAKGASGIPMPEKEKSTVDTQKFRKPAKVERAQDSGKKQPKHQKRPEETPPAFPQTRVEKKPAVKTEAAPPPKLHPQEVVPEGAAPPPAAPLMPHEAPLEPVGKEPRQEYQPPAAEEPVFVPEEEPSPLEVPRMKEAPSKEKTAEKKPEKPGEFATAMPATTLGPFFLPAASATPPSFTQLKPEVMNLFEKLVSMIVVMHETGVSETVIHLSPQEFTMFAGAQIVIREYTTAPKAFNIEFQGTAQNGAVFEQNVGDLMAAFQYGQYNFKINRMESSLLPSERPLFHRKGPPKEKGDKEGGLR